MSNPSNPQPGADRPYPAPEPPRRRVRESTIEQELIEKLGELKYTLRLDIRDRADSKFFGGLRELEMEVKLGKLLERYADFNFYIDYERRASPDSSDKAGAALPPAVTFFRERDENGDPIAIKVSRGEENIFIWCFFLAIVEVAMDPEIAAYSWVKYIYIDDPISSLDENNSIAVANHLTQMLASSADGPRVVVSTHHVLFFNVLCNELRSKAHRHFLKNGTTRETFTLLDTTSKPFLHHLSTLVELHEAQMSGALYTHHFNMLRRLMEQTANFFGMEDWKACIKVADDDPDKTLYKRMIDLMSHGDYSLYEPRYAQNPADVEQFEQQMRRKVHYVIKPDYLWGHIVHLAKTQHDELLTNLAAWLPLYRRRILSEQLSGSVLGDQSGLRQVGQNVH